MAWHYAYVHEYLTVCRWAFAATPGGRPVRLAWNGPALDREGWRRAFRRALDRRITLKAGPEPAWRTEVSPNEAQA